MEQCDRAHHGLPIAVRRITVESVIDLTPAMRRITFIGDDLFGVGEGAALSTPGFDDHIKLVFPDPSGDDSPGEQTPTGFAWRPGAFERARDYSIRRWDADSGRLDIDIVRHDGGLASAWAEQAQPGNAIHCAGPRSSAGDLPPSDWHLLLGDETALPAMARWLEQTPTPLATFAFIEVPSASDEQPLATSAHVMWLPRGQNEAAGTSSVLLDALRSFALPPGTGYAWCAGEAETLKPIRRLLRDMLPSERVEVHGYWRRTDATAQAPTSSNDRTLPAA